MAVTLKDVARQAQVSVQTVSNVIHGKSDHVSTETRLKVVSAIEELKYRPNLAARHLRNTLVGVLAIALPDLSNAYFSDIATAVIRIAATRNYTVLVDQTFADRTQEALVANGFRPHLIDGVILDPQALQVEDLGETKGSVPAVLLGERVLGNPRDHIAIDNVAAARAVTAHLVGLGRRRIAAIGTQQLATCGAPELRLQGYVEALTAAGIAVDPQLIEPGPVWARLGGAQAMQRLLALSNPPDAVFCFNDLMALGAMHVIHAAGLRIPQDIAVAGLDDVEDGRYANPPLTTIAPDKEEIARLAVDLLLGRIDGTRLGPPEIFTPTFELIVRASTIGPGLQAPLLHRQPVTTSSID